jgi:hypothetical protein
LAGNKFTSKGVKVLAEMLKFNLIIKEIDLSINQLENLGIIYLSETLMINN